MSIQLLGIFNYYLSLEIKPRRQIKQRERSLQNPVAGSGHWVMLFRRPASGLPGPHRRTHQPSSVSAGRDHCSPTWDNSEQACLLEIAYRNKAMQVNICFYFPGSGHLKSTNAYFSTQTNWFPGQRPGKWKV